LKKRKCILGVLKTEAGLLIKDEMLAWLELFYDVETVEVDPPNDVEFELPFIKRACEVALENRESVLYLHTKGAAMPNRAQPIVREMWKRIFTEKRDDYFRIADDREDTAVIAPFIARERKICWYNGFIMNQYAAGAILKTLSVHEDRYWFEQEMLKEAEVTVLGQWNCEEGNQAWMMTEKFVSSLSNQDNVPEGKLPVIVSLTSWKKRINTVGKTIESILDHCNPYKIVITLAVEEFPKLVNDLPPEIIKYARSGVLEVQWVRRNVKSFKKVLFTLNRYKNFPVVSADDDCIYTEDYVKILYDKWVTDKKSIWTYKRDVATKKFYFGHGPACIYPPDCFRSYGLLMLTDQIVSTNHDDIYYGVLAKMMGISVKQAVEDPLRVPYYFHDEIEPLSDGKELYGIQCINLCFKTYLEFIRTQDANLFIEN
jgi:hypothetical protein